jgi:hypothetical protein
MAKATVAAACLYGQAPPLILATGIHLSLHQSGPVAGTKTHFTKLPKCKRAADCDAKARNMACIKSNDKTGLRPWAIHTGSKGPGFPPFLVTYLARCSPLG